MNKTEISIHALTLVKSRLEDQDARIGELEAVLRSLDKRLRSCFGMMKLPEHVYDSFYQEMVSSVLAKVPSRVWIRSAFQVRKK